MSFLQPLSFAAWLALACASAAQDAPVGGGPPLPEMTPREAVLDQLLSERGSPEAFAKAVAKAREIKLPAQAILEARFLFHVDRHEDAAIADMLPEFLERRDRFKIAESEIFALKEDWLAVVEYVQAIAALRNGDNAGFKKHITEAFWLSPRQGAAFAPHIDRLRLNEAMRTVRIDFAGALTPLAGGAPVPLQQVLTDRKAIVLFFWSPWSRECEATLPGLPATTALLAKAGIAFAAIIPEHAPAVVANARNLVEQLKEPGAAWFIDDEEAPLHRTLRLQSVPLAVLVSPEGRVLFNGHPDDDLFWSALAEVTPGVVRPHPVDGPDEP